MSDTDTKTEEEELAEAKAVEETERLAKIKADEEADLEEGEDASTKAKEEEDAAAKAAEEEKAKAGAKKDDDTEPTTEDQLREEIAELKEKHSTADATVRALETKLTGINEVLKEQGFVPEEDAEKLERIAASESSRREHLSNLYEMMELSPKYPDLAEVVTTHNKQLVLDAYAAELVADDPTIDEATALAAVKQTINELSNPHKFYYEKIKTLEKNSEDASKEANKDVKKKDAKVTDAPASVANMGAGSGDGGAWTLSKLDNMTEEQLANAKIPQEILDQWKMGSLPK